MPLGNGRDWSWLSHHWRPLLQQRLQSVSLPPVAVPIARALMHAQRLPWAAWIHRVRMIGLCFPSLKALP